MKKKLLNALFCLILCFTIQSKANAMGLFYTDATFPITATGTKVEDLSNLRQGKSSALSILFLVETGDASIDAAARNGKITKISHIDVNEKSVFIFFRKLTVTVYGE